MAITYGFFNSKNHDRTYDAADFGRLFDGIITDGIFADVGNEFKPSLGGSSWNINIDTGRAWFNNTWTYNDAIYPLRVAAADSILDRIDAIIIEVDKSSTTRANTIRILEGAPSNNPVRPTMNQNLDNPSEDLWQYAICYVSIPHGATALTDDSIDYVVGEDETPYVEVPSTSDQFSVNDLVQQYETDFETYFENWSNEKNAEFNTFVNSLVNHLSESQIGALQSAILTKEVKPVALEAKLEIGQTSLVLTDDSIQDDSVITVSSDPYGIAMVSANQVDHTLYLSFKPKGEVTYIKVLVRN